ncbi:MAG: winged helix-turn-helix domain-containing protein [Woeseiaceae bacterium]|nr:winged helix-turn-helix domain-containing protein [Woeseiaceae bacterium]
MQQPSLDQGFRLDGIVVEPLEGTLTRADGETVHLEPKVMQVLVTLARQDNRTVARADILDTVWNGQVAADELLTRAISEIRRALGDDPRDPKFIRTVPKRGYRLIGAVDCIGDSAVQATPPSKSPQIARLAAFAAIAAVVITIAYISMNATSVDPANAIDRAETAATTSAPPRPRMAGRPAPLTSMEGSEWGPALSPDGRYAAFVASPPGRFSVGNIYVVEVGSAMPVPLTTDEETGNRAPTWSPDGTRIAFARIRDDGQSDIVVKPVLGGFETRLGTVDKFRGHDWSPDGEHLAIAFGERSGGPARIHLLSIQDGSLAPFTDPPGPTGDYEPRYSPDGRTLAFIRWGSAGRGANLCIKRLDGSAEDCITPEDKAWQIRDFDWAPDGESLIASVDGLLRVPLSGEPVEPLPFGDDAYNVATAPEGNRLIFERFTQDSNLWRLPGPAASERGEPERLIASTRAELLPRYSPDGSQIAFVSGRTGGWEVWVADADGTNPRRLTEWGFAAYPDWSPDGRLITFSSGRYAVGRGEQSVNDVGFDAEEAFLVEASGGLPRMISDGESGARAPSWSRDGRYVFFTRGFNDCGSEELWRRQLDSGEEARLSDCASRPLAGDDGRVYFYDKRVNGISSVPATGGDARIELSGAEACYAPATSWTLWRSNLVYVDCADLTIRMLDLETRQTTELAAPLAAEQLFEDLSLDVSPDGEWILLSRVDRSASDLILIEPFR